MKRRLAAETKELAAANKDWAKVSKELNVVSFSIFSLCFVYNLRLMLQVCVVGEGVLHGPRVGEA